MDTSFDKWHSILYGSESEQASQMILWSIMAHKSSIGEHTAMIKQEFTLDDFTLLEHQHNQNKLNALTSIHISVIMRTKNPAH